MAKKASITNIVSFEEIKNAVNAAEKLSIWKRTKVDEHGRDKMPKHLVFDDVSAPLYHYDTTFVLLVIHADGTFKNVPTGAFLRGCVKDDHAYTADQEYEPEESLESLWDDKSIVGVVIATYCSDYVSGSHDRVTANISVYSDILPKPYAITLDVEAAAKKALQAVLRDGLTIKEAIKAKVTAKISHEAIEAMIARIMEKALGTQQQN